MKKIVLLLAMLISLLQAGMFQSVKPSQAEIIQSNKSKLYCTNCGMNLSKFYKTNHAVKLQNGKIIQYCSLYCMVEQLEITNLKGQKDSLKKVMVIDVDSLKFIDAKKAFYVVGSSKKGTMSGISKYAFKKQNSAKKFANKYGGDVVSFEKAYEVALRDFAKDTAFVYNKRSSKMYKMGKKLFNSKCDKKKIALIDVHTIGDFKEELKRTNSCGKINDKKLQAISLFYWDERLKKFDELYGKDNRVQKQIAIMKLKKDRNKKNYKKGQKIYKKLCRNIDIKSINSESELSSSIVKSCQKASPKYKKLIEKYLWDIKRHDISLKPQKIEVPHDAKCPVCGMFVHKYPKWAASITTIDNKTHYFDGVKDMIKFYFEPHKYQKSKQIKSAKVTDYYTLESIDAKASWFVMSSNVYGPMGHELIAFDSKKKAKKFISTYGGKLITFRKIDLRVIKSLDE
jgi:copper chaperone NosL